MRWFRHLALATFLALGMLASVRSAEAHHHGGGHGHVSVGIGWGGYWGYPGWGYYGPPYYPYPYPYYPAYAYPPPNIAVIDTDISPEEAVVSLDGEEIGIADEFDGFPNYLEVEPGRHVVEFRYPGYRTLQYIINARRGAHYGLERKLERAASPSDKPDQAVVGPPLTRKEIEEQQRERREAEQANGEEPQPEVEPEPGPEPNAPEPNANEAPPRLVLKLRPPDAAVYLDGRLFGAGESMGEPDGIEIAPGRHVMDIVMPGYEPYRTTLIVHEGDRKSLAIRLTPLKQ